MREQNRDDIQNSVAFKGLKKTLEETRRDNAADVIARYFRGCQARFAISLLYIERILLVWDASYGRDFFYDKITGTSSWTPPRFLLKRHMDRLETANHDASADGEGNRRIWPVKKIIEEIKDHNNNLENEQKLMNIRSDISYAILVLQNFGRCVIARRRTQHLANESYRRVWDLDSGAYYYVNMKTYESTWTRPAIFLHPAAEPPVLLPADQNEETLISTRLLTAREKSPIDIWSESNTIYERQKELEDKKT